jgi:hypothetical protein
MSSHWNWDARQDQSAEFVDVNWKRCWKNVCVIVNILYEYAREHSMAQEQGVRGVMRHMMPGFVGFAYLTTCFYGNFRIMQ